jgi:hypothetical protein
LVTGSIGLGIALWGLAVFLGQMYRALDTGRFEAVPMRTVLADPHVRDNIPTTVVEWAQRITGGMEAHGVVNWVLDEVPLALILVVVGGLTAWRSFGWDAESVSREH